MISGLVFLFGLILGSFLNVCIYRLPLGQSLWGRSFCPKCKRSIFWYDNIPLLSYIILKARCRFCRERIPFRYFLVELLSGLIAIFLFKRYGLSFNFIFYLVFFSALIIASFIDMKHRIIPDEISLGGIFVGFVLNIFKGSTLDSLLGILIGGGIIYLTGLSFDFIYFKLLKKPPIDGETESMGGGDVKFLAMIGAFLGWKHALLTFFIAPLLGSIFGVFNLLITKKHTIAYGPFLALASFISFLCSKYIINFIFWKI
ncbi:MAG: prepilin peptidase [Candidatus Omnitrophica bacterium]|nr:prepilin peptidase [Candidatus Omnitrophota bacterium]MCM8799642.1 prepilin peptidase [Candidatus Omnitrophota bacterium]